MAYKKFRKLPILSGTPEISFGAPDLVGNVKKILLKLPILSGTSKNYFGAPDLVGNVKNLFWSSRSYRECQKFILELPILSGTSKNYFGAPDLVRKLQKIILELPILSGTPKKYFGASDLVGNAKFFFWSSRSDRERQNIFPDFPTLSGAKAIFSRRFRHDLIGPFQWRALTLIIRIRQEEMAFVFEEIPHYVRNDRANNNNKVEAGA